LRERVFARARIKAYVGSGRRIEFNQHGLFRHYPELDQ
jgi:glutathione S-transferase